MSASRACWMTNTITATIGEIDRAERRQDAAEDAEIRITDVVEEPLQPVERRRVRKTNPRHEDVREDEQDVDEDENVHEATHRRSGVGEQPDNGDDVAHGAILHGNRPSYRLPAALSRLRSFDGARSQAAAGDSFAAGPTLSGLVEEAAAIEGAGALLGRHLDVARREQEDLVGDALHAPVERVGQPAREVDQALRQLRVGALEVEDHRDLALELVRDLLGVVEAAR